MGIFEEEYPSLESYFRSVILFGRNSASYKFALARSLLSLSNQKNTFISLEELSVPFSTHITEHLKINDKQTTSRSSTFLNTCRDFNNGSVSQAQLIQATEKYGFVNVLDAFHNVNNVALPIKFFDVVKEGRKKGIVLTDDIYKINESSQFNNLDFEIEGRWRLVETAWSLDLTPNLLTVDYDNKNNTLFINSEIRRIDITSSREGLNGYQKGKCFYCFDNITIDPSSDDLADVDHFFPHTLQSMTQINLNGVWNLVLSCQSCNRGIGGKFAQIPRTRYLDRLHKRNNFFIDSHHPLRETLINQTGKTEFQRASFLRDIDKFAINKLIVRWEPIYEHEHAF
ncbi:HNH endonuclease domain-containing protein [Brevibacillus brevis]|uniref:HNH endonuclease domain-containing protein n=1 Tax=Brevibacillus brevis TaxID=1393 RepID=UPI0025A5BCD5|nr:HNH endonuclease domain-containing protein [Brevibacillus brevis]WJQ82613.1 HNH endonuclease domain-containing protein [Brevibacillus brevis]